MGLYTIVFCVSLEIIARVDDWLLWGAPMLGPYSFESLRLTESGGPLNRPNARFQGFQINSLGFRGAEFAAEKARGTRRIAVVGASEAFGAYESEGKDLTSQLQAVLDREAPTRYQVINAAATGMSPPRLREFYHQWLRRFDIDVLVFYPTPSFYLDNSPPREAELGLPTVGVRARRSLEIAFASRVADKVWNGLRRELPAGVQARLKQYLIDRERRRHSDSPWMQVPDDRVVRFRRHLEELVRDITDSGGSQLLLLTHANRFRRDWREAEPEAMVGWIRFFPRASGECLLEMEERANSIVLEIGGRNGIPVVDVARFVGGQPRNFADFAHFTDVGAKAAAEVIGQALVPQQGSSLRDQETR